MRASEKKLNQLVQALKTKTGDDDYDAENINGQWRLTNKIRSKDISPLMPLGQLCSWLNALMLGYDMGSKK